MAGSTAKYDSECVTCQHDIAKGESIAWQKVGDNWCVQCLTCKNGGKKPESSSGSNGGSNSSNPSGIIDGKQLVEAVLLLNQTVREVRDELKKLNGKPTENFAPSAPQQQVTARPNTNEEDLDAIFSSPDEIPF